MVKRKIVKQGAATMMVSLPAKWVKENKIEKGDEVNMDVAGQSIIISTGPSMKKESKIKLSRVVEPSIRTLISNTYRKGYDRITVEFDNPKQFKILENTIRNNLIGFEVIKSEAKSCVIENITEPSIDQFENLLKKMFMAIHDFFEITKKRLDNPEDKEVEDFEEVSIRVQKYDNFCRRCVSKQSNIVENPEFFWGYLTMIFHGQRDLLMLNKLIDKKTKVHDKTKKILDEVYELFKLSEKAYFEKDMELLGKMHDLEQRILREKAHMHFAHGKDAKEHAIVHHLISSARKFFQSNSPLAGLLV
jgi:phosphate uptake regulator